MQVRLRMIKETILLFFIGHFLGDYYFQTDKSVKNQSEKSVIRHSVIYAILQFLIILPVFNWFVLLASAFISMTHFIIDYIKFKYKQKQSITYERTVFIYIIDQVLHWMIIILSNGFLKYNQIAIQYLSFLQKVIINLQLNTELLLSWLLILLVIYRPASITIRVVLDYFEPKNKQTEDLGIPSAGALIGIFERLIILMMLYVGQYTAIGFVLTAKSVARYNKISEEPQFAEYYLLGTLLSSLLVIVSYYLIF